MDYGSKYADKQQRMIELQLQKVYREAQKDIEEKIQQFTEKHEKKAALLLQQVQEGKISEQQYKDWLAGQAFIGKRWEAKKKEIAESLLHANESAVQIVNGKQLHVFAENANYTAYQIETDAGKYDFGVNFDIYDTDTVARLIREKPELMPPRQINGKKDRAWNQGIISNTVTQSIIQGESIPKLAKRLAHDTANSNMKAMVRYARTAMTSAQNAGRIQRLHEAQDMGVKVQKQWLATLDNRTRDAHAMLDGQIKDIDEPFDSELGEIMYPGDPSADPANVYNCRCTLVYVYPDYPTDPGERLDNITGEHVRGDMTYEEWAAVKQSAQAQQQEPESALESKIQKAVQAVRPKKAQYTPAASCEEAEAYAGRFLGYNGKVSYKGIELEYANKCNQVLADIHETFDVEGLHGIQPMNTREKLWKTSTAEAAYRWGSGDLFINPRYYKSPAAFQQHKNEIDTLMETVMKGGQALIDSEKATGRKKDYIETLLRTGRQCVSQSYDYVEGTFVHECGHMMDDKIVRRELIQAFGGSNVRYGDLLAESRAKYGGQISGYAISDNQEYIAETFTAWWFGEGEKCDPVIVDVFERLVKK